LSFVIDKKTYQDLGIFNQELKESLFNLLGKTKTKGGLMYLKSLMISPQNELNEIYNRQNSISFFMDNPIIFSVSSQSLDFIEYYIESKINYGENSFFKTLYFKLNYLLHKNQEQYRILNGVSELINILKWKNNYLKGKNTLKFPNHLREKIVIVNAILNEDEVKRNLNKEKLSISDILKLDKIFRFKLLREVKILIAFVYEVDVYSSVANFTLSNNWCIPSLQNSNEVIVNIKGLFHPSILNPVKNDFIIDSKTNLNFLTGPNSAGKSSYLKAIGICIYLSHVGFPVPAHKMKSTIFNGLITSINISDSLDKGFSHFAAEVDRIKTIANSLVEHNKLLILIDELFNGTNILDSLDATKQFCLLAAEIKKSKFLVSSHFQEVGKELSNAANISFNYFQVSYLNNEPVLSYKLKDGISSERLGLKIIDQENIFKTLLEVIKNNL
jgi:DNA mismatch repair protein MutS